MKKLLLTLLAFTFTLSGLQSQDKIIPYDAVDIALEDIEGARGLYLEGNVDIFLPERIQELVNLEELNLNATQINQLPELGTLIKLRTLMANYNSITSLDESISNLVRLEELHLYDNRLTVVPEPIKNLQNLSILILAHNKIKELPEWLGTLKELRTLNIADCNVTEIPDWIFGLSHLELLDIHANPFNAISVESFAKLTELEEVWISKEQFNQFSDEIKTIKKNQKVKFVKTKD